MKQKKTIGAALLALCLLLTACGEKQSDSGPANTSGTGVYTSDIVPLDLPLTELTASGAAGGSLYLAGPEEEAPEEDGLEDEVVSSGSFSFSGSSDGDDVTFYSGMAGRAALYRLARALWAARHRRLCRGCFGGITGDLTGFFISLAELLSLLFAAFGGLLL